MKKTQYLDLKKMMLWAEEIAAGDFPTAEFVAPETVAAFNDMLTRISSDLENMVGTIQSLPDIPGTARYGTFDQTDFAKVTAAFYKSSELLDQLKPFSVEEAGFDPVNIITPEQAKDKVFSDIGLKYRESNIKATEIDLREDTASSITLSVLAVDPTTLYSGSYDAKAYASIFNNTLPGYENLAEELTYVYDPGAIDSWLSLGLGGWMPLVVFPSQINCGGVYDDTHGDWRSYTNITNFTVFGGTGQKDIRIYTGPNGPINCTTMAHISDGIQWVKVTIPYSKGGSGWIYFKDADGISEADGSGNMNYNYASSIGIPLAEFKDDVLARLTGFGRSTLFNTDKFLSGRWGAKPYGNSVLTEKLKYVIREGSKEHNLAKAMVEWFITQASNELSLITADAAILSAGIRNSSFGQIVSLYTVRYALLRVVYGQLYRMIYGC